MKWDAVVQVNQATSFKRSIYGDLPDVCSADIQWNLAIKTTMIKAKSSLSSLFRNTDDLSHRIGWAVKPV